MTTGPVSFTLPVVPLRSSDDIAGSGSFTMSVGGNDVVVDANSGVRCLKFAIPV